MDVRPLFKGMLRQLPFFRPEWLPYLDTLLDIEWSRPKVATESDFLAFSEHMRSGENFMMAGHLKGKRVVVWLNTEHSELLMDDLRKEIECSKNVT